MLHAHTPTKPRVGQLSLSSAQSQPIRLFASGYTDNEIAREMALSPEEVRWGFSQTREQWNVSERLELVLVLYSTDQQELTIENRALRDYASVAAPTLTNSSPCSPSK
jgi:DNA-binding NarL/FixJ family response regulator